VPIGKGQLVKRVRFSGIQTEPGDHIREQWSKPAMVVRGTYERSIHHNRNGRIMETELRMCIDILLDGILLRGLRASDFERVTGRPL